MTDAQDCRLITELPLDICICLSFTTWLTIRFTPVQPTIPLVTQQPLGGKAQFGGQRFGEMEVWALRHMVQRTPCRNF